MNWSKMNPLERLILRREMVKQAEIILRHENPAISKGALRVKADKFADAAIAREVRELCLNSSKTN